MTYDNTQKHVKYTIDMTKKDVYVGESGMQRQKLVSHAKETYENTKSDLWNIKRDVEYTIDIVKCDVYVGEWGVRR